MKVVDGLYFYGVVINCGINDVAYGENLAVVCLFNISRQTIEENAVTEFDSKRIIIGPNIVSRSYWTRGLFFNIGKKIDIPEDFSYGFHRWYGVHKENSYFVDEYRNELEKQPEFFDSHSLTTDIGIAYDLHYELIVDDSFLSKECQKLYRDYLNKIIYSNKEESKAERIGSFMIIGEENEEEYTIIFNDFLKYSKLFYKFNGVLTGNGYDWENVFKTYIKNRHSDKTDLFSYDSESDLMCVYSKDKQLAIAIATELDNAIQSHNIISIIEQTEFSDLQI